MADDIQDNVIVDILTVEQIKELRTIFKEVTKKIEIRDLMKLSDKERKKHRQALKLYYTKFFSVSRRPHPRPKRPSSAIKPKPVNQSLLDEIYEMELSARAMAERNELLKKENLEYMAKLSTQLPGNERVLIEPQSEPFDVSTLKEAAVLQWLEVVPSYFDNTLEQMNEVDEQTLKTEEKLKRLEEIAATKLTNPNAKSSATQNNAPPTEPFSISSKWGFGYESKH